MGWISTPMERPWRRTMARPVRGTQEKKIKSRLAGRAENARRFPKPERNSAGRQAASPETKLDNKTEKA